MSASEMPAPLTAWCQCHIQHTVGPNWSITSALRVPSRTGRVYRITAADGAAEHRRFFVKQFGEDESQDALAQRFDQLTRIATALQKQPTITAYVIAASDPVRRLLLSMETKGESVLALHRQLARRSGLGASAVIEAWRGVGCWLAALHHKTVPPVLSTSRAAEIAAYTTERFRDWAKADPAQAVLGETAIQALECAASRCARNTLTLRPCHGDVSGFNILVSDTVGLIDFDDIRFDLPALDLSQAVLELRNLSRVLRAVPLKQLMRRAERALVSGYGGSPPDGAEFWIQHFRNLSVFLLTLARRRTGIGVSRLTDELQYRRNVQELTRATRDVLNSDAEGSYWGRDTRADRSRPFVRVVER